MTANRGLVGALALAVLVWGVAFGGGFTIAVLTSTVDVTTTFETADNLTAIDDSSGDGFAAATAPVGNETGETEGLENENGSAPPENVTVPPENVTLPPENVTVPSENVTLPPDNASVPPENASLSENVSDPPDDSITNGSAPPEEEAVPKNETTTDTDDPAPSTSESTDNATAETAPGLRGDALESVSTAVHRSVGLLSPSASEA